MTHSAKKGQTVSASAARAAVANTQRSVFTYWENRVVYLTKKMDLLGHLQHSGALPVAVTFGAEFFPVAGWQPTEIQKRTSKVKRAEKRPWIALQNKKRLGVWSGHQSGNTFAEDFALLLAQCCRFQSLIALGTGEAGCLVPSSSASHHLFGHENRFACMAVVSRCQNKY